MSIVTISLPQGMYNNGTPYDAKGKWNFCNRVRWHDDALRAIGGWTRRTDYDNNLIPRLAPADDPETFRDCLTWTDNNNTAYTVFGSNKNLTVLLPNETLVTITPSSFDQTYSNTPTAQLGYGQWLYGLGNYGVKRPLSPSATVAIWRWTFDTWGEDLLAGPGSPSFSGGIYQWSTNSQPAEASLIPNAPTDVSGFVVTDQRIVMTIGSASEARLVRWSDREDYSVWTPDINNYAGSYFLQGNGPLLAINRVLNQILILSSSDAYVARYIGAPLVYGFDRVGNHCGPWCAQVVAVTDRFAMWPGDRNFWMYDGTIRPVPCPIMDFLAVDVDESLLLTAHSVVIPEFNEIWWFYASASDNEQRVVNSYVSFDFVTGEWSRGSLPRSTATTGTNTTGIMMVHSITNSLYNHEEDSIPVSEAYAETGFLEMGEGEQNLAVRYIYPDTETRGDVRYYLIGGQFPTDPEYEYGPYMYDNPISTRAMGRSIRMRVEGRQLNWKVGNKTRFDVAPIGTGRR